MNWDGIISLLLFCIEFILLLNVLYFSRKKKSLLTGVLIIALLASYQLTEYLICGIGLKYSFMAYIALSVISFLPPLNLLFIMGLLKKRFRLDKLIFIPAAALLVYYLTIINEFAVVKCSVLYAIYNYPFGDLYGLIYYLPIVFSLVLLFSNLKRELPLQKKIVVLLLFANLFICLPAVIAFILHFTGNSDLLNMIESIMCKFAAVLAVTYALIVLILSRDKSVE